MTMEGEQGTDQGQQFLAQARIQREIKDDYRTVFLGTPEGKRVLTDLLQHCGVLRPVYIRGCPESSAQQHGKQSIGLLLMDILDRRGYEGIEVLEREGLKLTQIGEAP
jgi:hypothetical protein